MALDYEQQQLIRSFSDLVSRIGQGSATVGDSLKNTAANISKHGSSVANAFDNIVKDLEHTDINAPLRAQIEQHRRLLSNESQWIDKTYALRKEELEQQSMLLKSAQVYGQQTEAERKQEKAQADEHFRKIKDQRKSALVAYAEQKKITQIGNIADNEKLDELRKNAKATAAEFDKANELRKAANIQYSETVAHLTDANVRMARVTSELAAVNINASIEGMKNSIKSSILGSVKAFGAFFVAAGTAAFYDIFKTMRMEMSRQGPIGQIDSSDTASLGLKRSEFAEMAGEYRRTMMAMGGMHKDAVTGEVKSVELLKIAQTELYKQTGDMALATKGGMLAFDAMARNGIKPTEARLKRFASTAQEVQLMSGVTLEQFASMQNDMLDDESTQIAMRAANSEAERDNIQANIQARIKENLALGMSTSQAMAAAKAMGKLGAEGPMERYKKSMKLQMAMGAMGVAGGEEAARIYRKPEHLRTNEEKRALQGSMSNYSNELSAQQGSENMGVAMVAEQIGTKSGFDEQSVAAFNTKAVTALSAEVTGNTKALGLLTAEMKDSFMYDALKVFDNVVSAIVNNPWAAIATGLTAGATALVLANAKVGMIFKTLGGLVNALKNTKLGGLFGGGASATAGGSGGGPGGGNALGNTGGGIAKFLGSIGKGIAGVGGGIGKAIKLILGGTAEGLAQLSNPKLFIGVAVLTALSGSMFIAGKAIQSFADVKWQDVALGMATMGGLAVLATVISGASVPMLIGAAAIAVLGGAMWLTGKAMQEFATAFAQFAEVKWDQLGTGLGLFGAGLGELWNKSPNPLLLGALAASIGALGVALLPLQLSSGTELGSLGANLGVLGQGLNDLYTKSPNVAGIAFLVGALGSIGTALLPLALNLSMFDNSKLSDLTSRMTDLSQLDAENLGAVADAMGKINANMSPTVVGAITSVATGVWDKLTGNEKPASLSQNLGSNSGTTLAAGAEPETKEEKNRKEFTINEQLKKMDDTNGHLSTVSTDIKQLVDLANKQLVVSTLTEKEKGDSRKKITGDSGGFSASSYQYI